MSTDDDQTPDATQPEASSGPGEGERIAKVLARAGVASRRDCERLILEGRVTLNGAVVTSPAVNVGEADRLAVDGDPVGAAEATRLWLYHKPAGLVTTERDEEGRPTVFDGLPEDMPRVMSVGRLDLTSEGLLILTNDGEVKRRLELPSTGWLRRYRVRINGSLSEESLDDLRRGVTVDGVDFQPMEVEFDRQQGANAWLTVGLREGKNREVRRVMEHLGVQVNRLIRVSYGPFQLGNLEPGQIEEVRARVVRDQLGLSTPRPAPQRRTRGEAEDLAPLEVETPERPELAVRRPAGATAKRSLKPRGDAPRRKAEGEATASRPAGTKQGPRKPAPGLARKARTFMRKDGPRPATVETDAARREAAREARLAERRPETFKERRGEERKGERRGPRGEGASGQRLQPSRPPRRAERAEGGERPRSAGYRSHGPRDRDNAREDRPRGRSAGYRSHADAADRPLRAGGSRPGGDRPLRPFGDRPRPPRDRAEGDDRRPARAPRPGPDARPDRDGDRRPARPDREAFGHEGPRDRAKPRSESRFPRDGERPARSSRNASDFRPARPRDEAGGKGRPDHARGERAGGSRAPASRKDSARIERSAPRGPAKPPRGPSKPRGGPSGRKPRRD